MNIGIFRNKCVLVFYLNGKGVYFDVEKPNLKTEKQREWRVRNSKDTPTSPSSPLEITYESQGILCQTFGNNKVL